MSDDLHKAQVPIRVIDDKGLSGVKFFKTPKFEKGTLLCRLNFRVSPLKRELKVRGLFCNFLGTICHCLFDCCTVFERLFLYNSFLFNDIENDICKIPINSTVECIFKADVFQRKVLRVEKQRRKMKKREKGKEM